MTQSISPMVDSGRPLERARGLVASAAETLFPGYFALVMATAAVSIANFLLGHSAIARLLS